MARPKDTSGNFLQQHYDRYRLAGGDHAEYVVWNDIETDLGFSLQRSFQEQHPRGVPASKLEEFAKLRKEEDERLRRAAARDDLEWMTGTGYYGQ